MADKDQAGECTPTRVLVEKEVADTETIEEMVRRMERELDEEFSHLFPATEATAMPTASAPVATEAEAMAAAAAATEAAAMVAAAAAVTAEPTASPLPSGEPPKDPMGTRGTMLPAEAPPKKPPEPTPHHRTWRWDGVIAEQPNQGQKPGENNMPGEIGATARELPSGAANRRPPYIAPAVQPPPDRDRHRRRCVYELKGCEAHQLKGCRRGRQSQSTSAKGVLDTKYLCPRPRVRGRIPIEDWRPPTGTQRTRRHGRSVFGRPAQ
jgi:hypothetical protein